MQKHVVDWDTSGTDEADPVGITSLSWAPLATPWCPYCFWFCFTLLRCGCDSTVKVLEEKSTVNASASYMISKVAN